MNVCMIVYNNATKDGRVMREAHSLRAAGHAVTVIGIPDPDAKAPVEYLEDGVRVLHVLWQARAYRKLWWPGLFRRCRSWRSSASRFTNCTAWGNGYLSPADRWHVPAILCRRRLSPRGPPVGWTQRSRP